MRALVEDRQQINADGKRGNEVQRASLVQRDIDQGDQFHLGAQGCWGAEQAAG
jgi:hypothetical protein